MQELQMKSVKNTISKILFDTDIGGFSEYFNRLSPTLKQSVIDRAEY